MDTAHLIALSKEALLLMVLASAPPIAASLIAGLIASVIQATTQVQDATLSVVPKLCAAVAALVIAGPSIGAQLTRFATELFLTLPSVGS